MVGVVIGHDQDRAQVGLVGLAGWDRLSQIEGGVRDELLQPLAIGPDARDALVPCGIAGRLGAGRPVVVGPFQRVHVGGIEAKREQIGLRQPHVLQQLPWGVGEPFGCRSAPLSRQLRYGAVEADVGLLPVEHPHQVRTHGTLHPPVRVICHVAGPIIAARCLGAQLAISVNNCPPPRDPRSRMTSFKRTQRKYVQKAYRVRNWREYETGLRARGSLTVWLGLTAGKLANWNSPRPTRRKPGRQRKYSNHAIETTVTLGLVFGLASRQTEGFLRSLLTLLNLDNDVPDHSTISRRKARLGKVASYERRTVKPVHLLIDSSGLSVHVGQLRTPPKARDYRKLHLAVDEQTSDVVACELTSKRARDASRVASLVGQIERPIASAKADAAYDTGDV